MVQHHQFDILGRLPTTANHDEREDHPQDRIQSGEKHLTIMPNPARTPGPRFLSPTGPTRVYIHRHCYIYRRGK